MGQQCCAHIYDVIALPAHQQSGKLAPYGSPVNMHPIENMTFSVKLTLLISLTFPLNVEMQMCAPPYRYGSQ